MSSTVEQIKERLSIADVVGTYLKLEKAGANYKAKCPFHNEKSPSFFVSSARDAYYCFGCAAKGDIFTFVQEFEGLDFIGALKVLAEKAGVSLQREVNTAEKSERERLFSVMEHSALFFQTKLSENKEALLYLKRRGLAIETVREWRIGYAPEGWRNLYEYLIGKNFSESEIEKAGLAKKSEDEGNASRNSGVRFYDRFRERVMFPIFDTSGRVIAFSGRILKEDPKAPKYLNSPDTPLFNKSHVLYGFNKAKYEIKKQDATILVEGQMDLLMSQQAGHINTVAVSGTALTPDHLTLLKRLSNKIIMAFDSDSAGFAASERGAKIALSLGMEVRMIAITGGKDPADLILQDPNAWKTTLQNSKHVIDFVFDKICATQEDSRLRAKEVEKKVLPYIASLESAMEKSHFVSKVASRLALREDVLWEELKKKKDVFEENGRVAPAVPPEPFAQKKSRKGTLEEKVASFIIWQESLKSPTALERDSKEKLAKLIGQEQCDKLFLLDEDKKNQVIFESELLFANSTRIEADINELFWRLEEEKLKEEFGEAMKALHLAEGDKNTEQAGMFLKKCQEISEKLRELGKKAPIS